MSPREQASWVIRERDRGRLRAMGLALGLSACLMGGALGVVWLKVQQVRLSYQLDALQVAIVEVEELNRQLGVEVATLRSLARIEDKALTELGMIPPAPDQVQLAREFVADGDGTASLWTAWETQLPAGARPLTGTMQEAPDP